MIDYYTIHTHILSILQYICNERYSIGTSSKKHYQSFVMIGIKYKISLLEEILFKLKFGTIYVYEKTFVLHSNRMQLSYEIFLDLIGIFKQCIYQRCIHCNISFYSIPEITSCIMCLKHKPIFDN